MRATIANKAICGAAHNVCHGRAAIPGRQRVRVRRPAGFVGLGNCLGLAVHSVQVLLQGPQKRLGVVHGVHGVTLEGGGQGSLEPI